MAATEVKIRVQIYVPGSDQRRWLVQCADGSVDAVRGVVEHKDGLLFLLDDYGDILAMYAAGSWRRVQPDERPQR